MEVRTATGSWTLCDDGYLRRRYPSGQTAVIIPNNPEAMAGSLLEKYDAMSAPAAPGEKPWLAVCDELDTLYTGRLPTILDCMNVATAIVERGWRLLRTADGGLCMSPGPDGTP